MKESKETWEQYNKMLQKKIAELDKIPVGDQKCVAASRNVALLSNVLAEKDKGDTEIVKSVVSIVTTVLETGLSIGTHVGSLTMYSDLANRILSIEDEGVVTTKALGLLTDFPKNFGKK